MPVYRCCHHPLFPSVSHCAACRGRLLIGLALLGSKPRHHLRARGGQRPESRTARHFGEKARSKQARTSRRPCFRDLIAGCGVSFTHRTSGWNRRFSHADAVLTGRGPRPGTSTWSDAAFAAFANKKGQLHYLPTPWRRPFCADDTCDVCTDRRSSRGRWASL